MSKKRVRYGTRKNSAENRMVNALDRLAKFEAFEAEILPALRRDLDAGLSAQDIIAKYEAVAAARVASLLASKTETVVLAAAKDMQDRKSGKATERKEMTHKLEKLSDEELKALVASEVIDATLNE